MTKCIALLFAFVLGCAFADSTLHSTNEHISHARTDNLPAVVYHPISARVTPYTALGHTDASINDTASHDRRGVVARQGFRLLDNESFLWGPNGIPAVELITSANAQSIKILNLERFSDIVDEAQCNQDRIHLRLVDNAHFDEIQSAWSWVNEEVAHYIVFVADGALCGTADDDASARQPWHVISASFDDQDNMVTLTAQPKSWTSAFQNWRLRLLSGENSFAEHRSVRRDEPGPGAFNQSVSLDYQIPNNTLKIEGTNGIQAGEISCINCNMQGALDLQVDIMPRISMNSSDTVGLDGHIMLVERDVELSIQLLLSITGPAPEIDLNLVTIPLFPFSIPGVLDIGPQLVYAIHGGIEDVPAPLAVQAGVNVSFAEWAIYRAILSDPAQNIALNWDANATALDPQLLTNFSAVSNGSHTFNANLEGQLKLEFAGKIMNQGIAVGIMLAAPSFDIEIATGNNTECVGGTSLDIGLGIHADAYETAQVVLVPVSLDQPIWSTSMGLTSTCFGGHAATTSTASAALPGVQYASRAGEDAASRTSSAVGSMQSPSIPAAAATSQAIPSTPTPSSSASASTTPLVVDLRVLLTMGVLFFVGSVAFTL